MWDGDADAEEEALGDSEAEGDFDGLAEDEFASTQSVAANR